MSPKPVIAISGLSCETSTFSPSRTLSPAFQPRRGTDSILSKYPFLHPSTVLGSSANWHGTLIGHALPGGIVTRESFESLAAEILSRLSDLVRDTKLDGLWYDIHGAMCVEGLDDAELELLKRIRRVVGGDVLVSASMDLHGNVSAGLAHETDLITCYRTAPHVDVMETKERACRNLVELLARRERKEDGGGGGLERPLKAWVPIPILLPGEKTSTRMEPAKGIYDAVAEVEGMDGVIDAAVWVGYAWADESRNQAVVVVTGWDEGDVKNGAERLAGMFWDKRGEFEFVAPYGSFTECLDVALASTSRPYFISDSGDNPTAGGAGDVTWTLNQLLRRPEFEAETGPKVIYASIPGPQAIDVVVKAGIGAVVTVEAGAEVDNLHAGLIKMTGRVHAIKHGDVWAETEAVVQVGSVYVIITKLRKPYHREADFTDLNLNSRRDADIVVVKIGYLEPQLFDMAADWMLALTPGGVDQDLKRLGHKRIQRPMWPFDEVFSKPPDLRARLIPPSHEPFEDPIG